MRDFVFGTRRVVHRFDKENDNDRGQFQLVGIARRLTQGGFILKIAVKTFQFQPIMLFLITNQQIDLPVARRKFGVDAPAGALQKAR